MLIDATQPEEVRVAVLSESGRVEEFDFETLEKKNLKGNIYLAKVVRIEPALQAAFVEYGGARHGFLAFDDIHPDYFRIPISERAEIESAEERVVDDLDDVEEDGFVPRRLQIYKNYKIQEVLKRGQIMLVQVVKEERGNKGAALTTYLSLAGRYCVLMPNAGHGCGGVSRKISDVKDRKRLRTIIESLKVPETMGLIIRTAGLDRTKIEIRKDADYLMRLWEEIRDLTMTSVAPALIHMESGLIKRTIRDAYSKDVDKFFISGEEGYKEAKNFIKMLMPSHAKRIQHYKDPLLPLFQAYKVEEQIDEMYSPVVPLKSGGYLIINPTEALVSIDVNSGKATKERHIEETAIKTNIEAAEEVARVLRLRDLAGLVVIDFIDMEDEKNVHLVERRFKEAIKIDRARIQVGRISMFGLLELSRQRLRPSLLEASTQKCSHCEGLGVVRSIESSTLQILRLIEAEAMKGLSHEMTVSLASSICLHIVNHKKDSLSSIEQRFNLKISLRIDDSLNPPNVRIDAHRKKDIVHKPEKIKKIHVEDPVIMDMDEVPEIVPAAIIAEDKPKKISRSARRRKNRLERQKNPPLESQTLEPEILEPQIQEEPEPIVAEQEEEVLETAASASKKKRQRSRKKTGGTDTVQETANPEVTPEIVKEEQVVEDKKTSRTSNRTSKSSKNKPAADEPVSRPLFDGVVEEKKLVLDGETFKLGRPFIPVVPPTLLLEISEEKLRKDLLSDGKMASKPSTAGPLDNKVLSDDPKQKKEKAWWQKLLK